MRRDTIVLGVSSVLFLLVIFLLLLGVNMRRGLNHDEYQFVASGKLLASGLLPYQEYPYFHVPGLSLIYAGLFRLSDRLLLSARLFSVICAWMMNGLLFAMTLAALRGERLWVRLAAAIGVVLLLVGSPIFLYTSGRAWNHDLPMLLTLVAFGGLGWFAPSVAHPPGVAARQSKILMVAHPPGVETARLPSKTRSSGLRSLVRLSALCLSGAGFQPALVSGILMGLATATRLSFAFGALAFMLALLIMPQASWRQRWREVVNFGLGGLLGATPALLFLFWSPQAFIFGNFTYIGLNTQYYRSLSTPPLSMTLVGKLNFLAALLRTTPANGLLLVALVVGIGLCWRSRRNLWTVWRWQIVAFLFASMLGSGLVATPSQSQYFYPLWPLAGLGIVLVLGTCKARGQHVGTLFSLLLLGLGLTAGLLSSSPYRAGLEIVFSPREWYPTKLHARGALVRTLVDQGEVLTVAPIIPLEGGVAIYPELATGPFAWRVAPLLAPEARRRYHLYTPDELIERLADKPPRALLVGLENDDVEIEQSLVAWAQARGYMPIALPDEGELWVSPLAEWGGAIRLGAHTLPQSAVQPGATVAVVFYLQNIQPLSANLNILVRLLRADDQEYWRAEGWPWGAATSDWQPGAIWPDGHQINLPATMPPGCYRLDVSFYNPETFDPLGEPVTVGHLPVGDQPSREIGDCS